MPGSGAVVGYAIGTVQVLFVDWWRRISTHRRQLRLLRAELRRLSTFKGKHRWEDGLPPEDEQLPIAPKGTDLFTKTVGEVEWTLTDEHSDDNSQQSMLQLLDGCSLLGRYAEWVLEVAEKAPHSTGPEEKEKLRKRGAAYADAYDDRLDAFLFLVDDALTDLDRRLNAATFTRQLKRVFFGRLRRGSNPPPLERNDPRIDEWKTKQIPPVG